MPSSTKWRLNITATNDPPWIGIVTLTMAAAPGGPNLCVGGTASASSTYSTGYLPAYAFDTNLASYWSSAVPTGWLEYEFPTAVAVAAYTVQAQGGVGGRANYAPQAWTLEYWDGAAWQVADTVVDQTDWWGREVRSYPLVAKMRWRLVVHATRGSASLKYAEIAEIELRAVAAGANLAGVAAQATSDSVVGGFLPQYAIDAAPATSWSSANSPYPHWWSYWFAAPVDIREYVLQASAGREEYAPQIWTLEYWDGAAWVLVDSRWDEPAWAPGERRTFLVPAVVPLGPHQLAQLPLEILIGNPSDVPQRVGQLPLEVLIGNPPAVAQRVSQLPLEALIHQADPVLQRVSQLPLEVLVTPAPTVALRLSQLPLEVALTPPSGIPLRLAQLPLEILLGTAPSLVLTSVAQLPLEVLTPWRDMAVSQLPLEVLTELPPAQEVGVTQAVTEIGRREPASSATVTQVGLETGQHEPSAIAVTQVPVETARHGEPSAITATQLPVELASREPLSRIDVSQCVIEIIRLLPKEGEPPDPPPTPVPPRPAPCPTDFPID